MNIRIFVISILSTLFLMGALFGQVVIAPPLVVVDQSRPFGEFLVINQSDKAQEITVSFVYGFPVSDSTGTVSMSYIDEPGDDYASAADLIRAFPRRFVLEPFQEQTVRLTVRPRGNMADGTYTARIVTSSTPLSAGITASSDGVSAQVNFVFNQVSAFLYKHGTVSTGIDIMKIHAGRDSLSNNVFVSMVRTGNSPFLGMATVTIYDDAGAAVHTTQLPIAVYFDLTRRFDFDADVLPPGSYTVEVIVTTEGRTDIPREHRIKTTAVSKRETIVFPP